MTPPGPALVNKTRNLVLARQVEIADRFFPRLRGLMFRPSLPAGTALWLKPCNGVHMFFMAFPLDIIFLDGDLKVTHVIHGLQPWRVSPIIRGAESVLELPAESTRGKVAPGEQLAFGTDPPDFYEE